MQGPGCSTLGRGFNSYDLKYRVCQVLDYRLKAFGCMLYKLNRLWGQGLGGDVVGMYIYPYDRFRDSVCRMVTKGKFGS